MANNKVLVFDLNGVFFYTNEDLEANPELRREALTRAGGRFLSPVVHVLMEYFQQHPCTIVIWSTMMRKNMLKYVRSVENHLQISAIFSQEDCDEGPMYPGCKAQRYKKDLRKVAEKMNVTIDDCVLIDDSPVKRVGNQNFYKYEYTPNSYKLINFINSFLNENAM